MQPSGTPIPFEQFMARALHDPESGYYARRISEVGRRGDFTTTPMRSNLPARAIAAWAGRALRETGARDLIELGPGEGTLARDVWRHLPWSLRWRTRLHLVETSTPLAARQRDLLGRRVQWHVHACDAMKACNGRAVIYSNEFVDAFPVRRFERTNGDWHEVAVMLGTDGHAAESLHAPTSLPPSTAFHREYADGQRIEVHAAYRRYLEEWLPMWKAGRMLTIDYGSAIESLYHRRPRGTLRGYLHHQLVDGMQIYQNPGRQDLTADVNFTDLQTWSAAWVSTQQQRPLREFLLEWLDKKIPGDRALLGEHDAGDAFQVLEQTR